MFAYGYSLYSSSASLVAASSWSPTAASLFCGRGFFLAINIDEVQFRLSLVPFVAICRIVCTIRWAKPRHHTHAHTHMCAVHVGVCACIYNHSCILCLIDCQIELSIENTLQKLDCSQQAAPNGRWRRGGKSTRRCLIEFTCASYNGIVPSDCQELKELCCLLRTSCCSEVIVRRNE